MQPAHTHAADGEPASRAALAVFRLAERWAEAARAQAIYPPGHHRVGAALAAWGQALEAARTEAGGAPLQVVFTGQGLLAQEVPFETSGDNGLTWLRERLDRAALAGVLVSAEATPASLEAFDRRLLEVFARRDPVTDVAAAWAQGDWPGLMPLDRRFEGVFDGERLDLQSQQRTWSGAGPGIDAVQQGRLVESLLGDPGLVTRLRGLSASLASTQGKTGSPPASEPTQDPRRILESLTQMLPALAVGDASRTRAIVAHLLEALEERQGGRLSSAELSTLLADPGLERRAAWLCSAMLRQDVAPQRAAEVRATTHRGPQGHAGDEQFTEDVGSFLEELAGLPASHDLDATQVESPAEQLGVLLHLLLHHEDPQRLPGLLPLTDGLLEAPDRTRLSVLRRVLCAAEERADATSGTRGQAYLTDTLRTLGRLPLLRQCGFLSAERVTESFPACFGDWLGLLRPEQPEDVQELQQVLAALGPRRVAEHALELSSAGCLGQPGLAGRLLALPLTGLAPLARIWLERGGPEQRAAVAGWLRSMRLPDREAHVLETVEDAATLPDALLQGLIDCVEGRPLPAAATGLALEAIVQFVREAAGREDRRARRLEALRQLGRYEHPEALAVLNRVVTSRRWLFLPVEESLARQVAAATLRTQGAA